MDIKNLFSLFRTVLYFVYNFVHTHSRTEWVLLSLKTQHYESGDSCLEACVVICSNFVLNGIVASVHVVVFLIWTSHQSSIEYVVVWIRAVECVPVTWGRCGWARTAKLFIAWDTVLIERLSWVLDSPQFRSLLTTLLKRKISVAEWIFSMAHCSSSSVRNWKYTAYRDTSHVPAVDDGAGKDDTAIRCGMTLDGEWLKATRPDLQAITMTANRHLRYNNLKGGGPEKDLGKLKTTHQILVQIHTKSTLRPSRIWTRYSTVKYRETLDASPEGKILCLSALAHSQSLISDVSLHDLFKYNDAIRGLVRFVVIIILTWVRWEGNVSFGADGWNRHRLIQIM